MTSTTTNAFAARLTESIAAATVPAITFPRDKGTDAVELATTFHAMIVRAFAHHGKVIDCGTTTKENVGCVAMISTTIDFGTGTAKVRSIFRADGSVKVLADWAEMGYRQTGIVVDGETANILGETLRDRLAAAAA